MAWNISNKTESHCTKKDYKGNYGREILFSHTLGHVCSFWIWYMNVNNQAILFKVPTPWTAF